MLRWEGKEAWVLRNTVQPLEAPAVASRASLEVGALPLEAELQELQVRHRAASALQVAAAAVRKLLTVIRCTRTHLLHLLGLLKPLVDGLMRGGVSPVHLLAR